MNPYPPSSIPLKVSVLIRTTGRPSLLKAVESVSLQKFKGVELLIANGSGRVLSPMPVIDGDIRFRMIEPGETLDRGSAAQILLDTASAPYAIFLDDDDWWLEGHLVKLAQALDTDEDLVAAYSDVNCLAEVGTLCERLEHVFQQDFDRAALQLSNFLPIHAVMFRMRCVNSTPKSYFDPDLKLFEDWDFWIQLSRKGSFTRVPGVSAVYALNTNEGSGHTDSSGSQRARMLAKLGEKQLKRWSESDVLLLMARQAAQINECNHLSQLSVLNSKRADELVEIVSKLKQRTVEMDLSVASQVTVATELKNLLELSNSHAIELEGMAGVNRKRTLELEKSIEISEKRVADLDLITDLIKEQHEALKKRLVACTEKRAEAENSLAEYQEKAKAQLEEWTRNLELKTQALKNSHLYAGLQQAEIDKLSALRLSHLAEINAVYHSTSWKITRSLRSISRLTRSLLNGSSWGLAKNIVMASRVAIQRHGIKGFALRVPYYTRRYRTYIDLLKRPVPSSGTHEFVAAVPQIRSIRLHPDLAGGGEMIEAKVSVVIPTLNAGSEFVLMLRKLRSQKSIKEIEIVIVDSGSTDDTVQVAIDAGVTVIEILPAEFTHSYARNLGADNATGDYILFMVQDAYPIGTYWMYGMLSFLLDHSDQKLVAVSCSEYSRSDSDMMYDSMINTHYRFLGCLEHDRIGEFGGNDHMALRSRGQLSDVSCLILRKCFMDFRYRGNYAEDLDLGVRLIKSGFKVGMLASVKVIHSHNRPAYYYLKRSFVDVIFLVGLFDDFAYPECQSLSGLIAGIKSTATHISRWLLELEKKPSALSLGEQLNVWIMSARKDFLVLETVSQSILGDARLDDFVNTMSSRFLQSALLHPDGIHHIDEARNFGDSFLARLDHFRLFASEIYVVQDALTRKELSEVVCKTFAAAAGSALAFYCLGNSVGQNDEINPGKRIHDELAAGV